VSALFLWFVGDFDGFVLTAAAHKCPIEGCGKDFSRHDNLGQHMRVHKGQALTHMLGDA
jgi:hypothetical protein